MALVDHGSSSGRSSWDPMCLLLAIDGDAASGGYYSVRGTATVSASTGANTFTPDPYGPHEYVIKSQPDSYYVAKINGILTRTTWSYKKPNRDIVPMTRFQSQYDRNNLLYGFVAEDLSDYANADSIESLPDYASRKATVRAISGDTNPLYKTAIGTKNAIDFSAGLGRLASDSIPMPEDYSIYVKVFVSATPSGNQTIIAQDLGAGYSLRSWHIKLTSTGVAAAVFVGLSGNTIPLTISVPTNAWFVVSMRKNGDAVVVGCNTTYSTTSIVASQNRCPISIVMGGSRSNGAIAEAFLGSVNSCRIYNGAHSDVQASSIITEMLA